MLAELKSHPKLTKVNAPGFRLTCRLKLDGLGNQELKVFKDILLGGAEATHMTLDEKTAFLGTLIAPRLRKG